MSEQFDPVTRPYYYTSHSSGVECIEIVEHLPFNVGNAIKYLWRAGIKTADAVQDLEKARWYVDREIKRLQKAAPIPMAPDPIAKATQDELVDVAESLGASAVYYNAVGESEPIVEFRFTAPARFAEAEEFLRTWQRFEKTSTGRVVTLVRVWRLNDLATDEQERKAMMLRCRVVDITDPKT